MKKLITLLAVICMILSLCGCNKDKTTGGKNEYSLGMGVITSLEASKTNTAEADVTVASVILDAEGKIVACAIDVAQNKVSVLGGCIAETSFLTKMELGYNYGLKSNLGANYEWFEQVHAFEAYCIGKTVSEVEKIETRERNDQYAGYIVAKDETLYATCTIQIIDFIAAVVKACKDEQAVKFNADSFKLGVAINSFLDNSSTDASKTDGVVHIYSDIAAAVIDSKGKVLAAINDCVEPKVSFDIEGSITKTTFSGSKRDLKEDYTMKQKAGTTYEWYQQASAFSAYCVGKTASEIEDIKTKTRDDKYYGYIVAADEKLFASCSIQISGLKAVTAKAAKYAATPAN